ncbi:hypothetical protein Q4599_17255 [Cellulophaga lytica]|uniref:hypothetical protein n=1 Tax=Cellulophaga lytica TaxID=979 RepID=UPI0026E46D56|nr:hypothetical protein [Cellulophaga lytica]MDO6855328.1 hypothetical protein [Cellulophaga lytica]
MTYRRVKKSSDPKIIGVKNGIYQVEIKPNISFQNKKEEKLFDNYFDNSLSYFKSTEYKPLDKSAITYIRFIPLKSAYETDIVSHSPNVNAMFGIISDKVLRLIEKFKLPEFIKIRAEIEGFENDYFFVGFPIISYDLIDFSKSKFYHTKNQIITKVKNKEDYIENSILSSNLFSQELFLLKKVSTDIFYLQSEGLFFSNKLLSALEKENITGLEITDNILSF